MRYNWNWGILLEDPYFGWLVTGIEWTLIVSAIAWIIAFSVGSLVGVARSVISVPIRAVATAYVVFFRNIPLLVQMFIWFYVVPELLPDDLGRWMKRDMPFPEVTSAILCLGTYTASRVAEQVRAGIDSIPRGQTMAGLAMGLTLP
ncbi:MAG: ABC transporter permease subunit, partial [Rhodospirillales bacterium]|nr:ABC transporter permease subunit [Rhodospirillales bacterium]